MRDHISCHIREKTIDLKVNTCGFCGLAGTCVIDLKNTSGFGNSAKFGPSSQCSYFRKFNINSSIKAKENFPIECSIRKMVYWSYCLKLHFQAQHIERLDECPQLLPEYGDIFDT